VQLAAARCGLLLLLLLLLLQQPLSSVAFKHQARRYQMAATVWSDLRSAL